MESLFVETRCLMCPVVRQALRLLKDRGESTDATLGKEFMGNTNAGQPEPPAQHTGCGCSTGDNEAPWYEPLRAKSVLLHGNCSRTADMAAELVMLGELGLSKEKALSVVYRSAYGASMTATEIEKLS